MIQAFDRDATDFSAMVPMEKFWIDKVKHKTVVDVSEKGTEAARSQRLGSRQVAQPTEPIVMNVDRPFSSPLKIGTRVHGYLWGLF